MKLNNKGWGLGAFFGFSLIVVIAIIIASIKSYNFGLNNDDSSNIIFNDSSTYIKLENNSFLYEAHYNNNNSLF